MKSNRQSGSDRRLSLLQAALDLFSTQGYDGTTTRAIAERAGVTEALLFKHFHTKQALLYAVTEEFGPRRMFAAPPEDLETLPVREALEQMLIVYLDTFWENRACLRMLFMATDRDRAAFEELRKQFGNQTLYLYAMLQERGRKGEIAADAVIASTDIISAAIGGFLQRTLREEPEEWQMTRKVFINHLMRVLFGGLESTLPSVKEK